LSYDSLVYFLGRPTA